MTAISPQDWQDQEDGRALRMLREALVGTDFRQVDLTLLRGDRGADVLVRARRRKASGADGHFVSAWSIAQAADMARQALKANR